MDADAPKRSLLRDLPRRIWRGWTRVVHVLSSALFGTLLLVLGVLFVNYVVLSTPKDHAYRNLDPANPGCAEGLRHGWTILADDGVAHLGASEAMEGDGWHDLSDNEADAVARDRTWATLLRCSLQRHVIPARRPGGKPIDYTLGFVEFQQDGEPYALVANDGSRDEAIDTGMLQHAMESEMHAHHMTMEQVHPVISQLDVLKQHLSTGSNYVLVFVEGWRHDASIGDQDVADTRLYAANAARFLAQRCATETRFCDMKVTAVYIGWRGARVDEKGLIRDFGRTIGGTLGTVSAAPTLFDRKPVAEAIAPSAVSALRTIEGVLAAGGPQNKMQNKMIVFGHSLGGDMLATGLKNDLLKAVDRHRPGEVMPPVLGDLIVLINPAAEAEKWTDIQREVWNRVAYHETADTPAAEVARGNDFFPATQRPVVVSVTSALAFPPGGLRPGDCAWIGLDVDDQFKRARELIRIGLAHTDAMFTSGVDYDWATHDLFPTFKFDFRPASAYLDRVAARLEHRQPRGESCQTYPPAGLFTRLKVLPIRGLSLLAATFPFQTTNVWESHTIGNLDPPRPPAGVLADALPSAAPFGTTHELLGLSQFGAEKHHPYATLADADIDCPATNRWLTRARERRGDQHGLFWDSEDLAPATSDQPGQGKPAARFLQGLPLSGTAPITRADDPFWNIRAFDNALSRHDGYRLTSFMCAMNALVMDDITSAEVPLRETVSEAHQPGSAILK